MLDDLLPDELDWQDLVVRYPKSALAVAAAGGFLLGYRRGRRILEALAGFAEETVGESVNHLLGEKVI